MGIFAEVRNEQLIRELHNELNTDVVLFSLDGFAYFGNLQAVEDCRLAVLAPAVLSESDFVQILGPSEVLLQQSFARVDLWTLVGKATAIADDPFFECHDNRQPADPPTTTASRLDDEIEPVETLGRQESHCLIRQLRRSLGDEVAITTLGGFWFEGVLSVIDDCLAILTAETIVIPGRSTDLTGIRSVVVNLEAITSVSG
jgi:small nuclear ribonucleoprotein (snRNP)-like protein